MSVLIVLTVTIHAALTLLPSVALTVIFVEPLDTAVTLPSVSTVATDGYAEDHVRVFMVNSEGRIVAVKVTGASPTYSSNSVWSRVMDWAS